MDKNKTRGRGLDKRLGLYTLNCLLLQNFFKGALKEFVSRTTHQRERERERREEEEDKEEEEDESFSAEEQLFSYASFLSFLCSFFGVLERGLC